MLQRPYANLIEKQIYEQGQTVENEKILRYVLQRNTDFEKKFWGMLMEAEKLYNEASVEDKIFNKQKNYTASGVGEMATSTLMQMVRWWCNSVTERPRCQCRWECHETRPRRPARAKARWR